VTPSRLALLSLVAVVLLAACGTPEATPPAETETTLELAPASSLSPELRKLSPDIQEAYRFAIANRDVLEKIPCYCGCGGIGHTDNWTCYVQPESTDRIFDYHAAG
jgi:hypothetical protein